MKNRLLWTVLYSMYLSSLSFQSFANSDVSVMTFNVLHFDSEHEDTPRDWTDGRGQAVINTILSKRPDVLGVQEMTYYKKEILINDLPKDMRTKLSQLGYKSIKGVGGSPKDIFYASSKFTVKESGTAYLWPDDRSTLCPNTKVEITTVVEDGVEVEKKLTGQDQIGGRRSVVWGALIDKVSGKEFFAVNTHLHHAEKDVDIRTKQFKCIRKLIKQHSKNRPVVFMGDLNSRANSREIYEMESGFQPNHLPLFDVSARNNGPEPTYNGFRGNAKTYKKLDYIFARGFEVAEDPEVVKGSYKDGDLAHWPSDHYPLYVELNFHADSQFVDSSRAYKNLEFYKHRRTNPQYCTGYVEDWEVARWGTLYVDGTWNGSDTSQALCNLDGSWKGVPGETCRAWVDTIRKAAANNSKLKLKYQSGSDCLSETLGEWEQASVPEYVRSY